MKILFTLLLNSIVLFVSAKSTPAFKKLCEVNKCWTEQTDVSNLAYPENTNLSEQDWIRTHLQLVEQTLRTRSTEHLTTAQKANRLAALDQLNKYWHSGAFPVNDEYNYRTPIFIDKYDNFCAVGYLVKATGHEDVSRMIAAKTNLAYVREMNYTELFAWANEYGFTVDELAWIQPSYPPETYIQAIGKGTDGTVNALCADDATGKLYVGGQFEHVDSTIPAQNLAYVTEENGTYTWHKFADVNGSVHAIYLYNGKVYIGGKFTEVNGVAANNIAWWDGANWHALGCINGTVNAIAVSDDKLYVAGDFDICAAMSEVNFARWEGNKWQQLDILEGAVNTMFAKNYEIILGGKFSYLGKQVNIIKFNSYSGWAFEEYNNIIPNEVNYIGYHNNELYAATTGDVDVSKLVMKLDYYSDNWNALYQYAFKSSNIPSVHTLCSYGNNLMAGGALQYKSNMQPGPPSSRNCAIISQNQLLSYNGILVDSTINVMATFKGRLIAAGNFKTGYTGKWDGELNGICRWFSPTDVQTLQVKTSAINLYPNPVSSGGSLSIEGDFGTKYLKLYDLVGKLVLTHTINNDKVNLPELSPGIYIAELSNAQGEKAVNKIIVE